MFSLTSSGCEKHTFTKSVEIAMDVKVFVFRIFVISFIFYSIVKFINTDITCRLDSLPWTGFHTRFVFALGITWVLDAFEVVIVSAVLKPMAKSLEFTPQQSSM
ncbi:MAG: hypothetical protein WKI48_04230, partial [Aquificaceae bacterium]